MAQPTPADIEATLRDLVAQTTKLRADPATLAADADLYAAGLSSLATVDLMLAIEDHFAIEFPQDRLSRRTFGSIASIAAVVAETLGAPA